MQRPLKSIIYNSAKFTLFKRFLDFFTNKHEKVISDKRSAMFNWLKFITTVCRKVA